MAKVFADDPSHRFRLLKVGRSHSKYVKCITIQTDEITGNTLHCTFQSRCDRFKKDIAQGKIHQCEFGIEERDNPSSVLHYVDHDPIPIPHIDNLTE
jgi:hypothetical protein